MTYQTWQPQGSNGVPLYIRYRCDICLYEIKEKDEHFECKECSIDMHRKCIYRHLSIQHIWNVNHFPLFDQYFIKLIRPAFLKMKNDVTVDIMSPDVWC